MQERFNRLVATKRHTDKRNEVKKRKKYVNVNVKSGDGQTDGQTDRRTDTIKRK